MVCLQCTIMRQRVCQDLFQLKCTRFNLCEKLVEHVHGGHVVTKHTNKNFAKMGTANGLTHSTQLKVVVVHQLNVNRGPGVLYKMKTMYVLVPSTPATRASVCTNNNSALGSEPVALDSVLSQTHPILLQVSKGTVGKFNIPFPTVTLRECSIQVCQVESAKG